MTVTSTARVATDRGERHLERFGEKDGLAITWQ
jgi:hypothetical protein